MKPGPKVFKVGEPILTTVAALVTPEEFGTEKLSQIVKELETIARGMGAVGFSAPQIGHTKRVMIIGMEFDNPRRPNVQQFPNMVFVNPVITKVSEDTSEDWEGCASFDNALAYVPRPIKIQYEAQDVKGNRIEGELKNFSARVFQHELDHLDGILMDTKAIKTKEFDRERDVIISLRP